MDYEEGGGGENTVHLDSLRSGFHLAPVSHLAVDPVLHDPSHLLPLRVQQAEGGHVRAAVLELLQVHHVQILFQGTCLHCHLDQIPIL